MAHEEKNPMKHGIKEVVGNMLKYGWQNWKIPMIAMVIVLVTFVQLGFAFRNAVNSPRNRSVGVENQADYAWSNYIIEHDRERFQWLSMELQEMTRALNYEIMRDTLGEGLNLLRDIAQIPRYSAGQEAVEFYLGSGQRWMAYLDDLDDELLQEAITIHLNERLDEAQRRLSVLSSTYGISYLATHADGISSRSGRSGLLDELLNDETSLSLIHDLHVYFAHVIVIHYNDHGRWEVPFILTSETFNEITSVLDHHGGSVEGFEWIHLFNPTNPYQFDLADEPLLDWQNPRNMTFVYGIPHVAMDHFVGFPDLPQTGGLGMTMQLVGFWEIFPYANLAIITAVWSMIAAAMVIPLSKIKQYDVGFGFIQKFPIEAIATLSATAWLFIISNRELVINHIVNSGRVLSGFFSHQNVRMLYFHGWLFIGLTSLGYLVYYVKEMHASKWENLAQTSYIYNWLVDYLAVDLKKGQTLRILITIIGLPFIGFLIFLGSVAIGGFAFGLFMLTLFVGLVFLYTRHKVAKIRKDYLKLFEITQELADGMLDVEVPENLGYFNSLKIELATLQNGLHHAVERALSSERMKGDLITNVSHDLKTPLTSLITYVDLLQVEGISEEKRQQYLKTLELKTERLRTLIEDLFEVSKASSGNLELDIREVDVTTLMKQTILGLEDRISEAGLILREGYPEGDVKMALDGGRMHRVFENLIINMVKYAMPGTRAYIDIMKIDSHITIILRNISNHEITIDMNDLSERFVRGESARTTEGSGLGLAIAKSFVELQGGTFEITVDGDLFKVIITFKP